MHLRPLRPDDRPYLAELLRGLSEFTPAEVECALELLDLVLAQPGQKDYQVIVAGEGLGTGRPGVEHLDKPVGYACFGPTPMTESTWDLYWIATRADCHGQGVGKGLLRRVEQEIAARGGRTVRIETSAKDAYGATRGFYEKNAYRPVGQIANFYRAGDDLVILAKELPAIAAHAAVVPSRSSRAS